MRNSELGERRAAEGVGPYGGIVGARAAEGVGPYGGDRGGTGRRGRRPLRG